MDMIRQIGAVTQSSLSTIPSRLGASLVVVVGMACAVGALVSVLSISTGFMQAETSNARPDRAIVLSQGALFEGGSTITRDEATTINSAPGIRRAADGKPIISAEIFTNFLTTKKNGGLDAYVQVRGIGPEGLALRPEIHLISGRMFRPGKYEVIVGKSGPPLFDGLSEGSTVALPQGDWKVVGTFESKGDMLESAILTDEATLASAMRTSSYKSVMVMLSSPEAYAAFKKYLTTNPSLSVEPMRETDYVELQARQLNLILRFVAFLVGGIMGLGAMFGALNTMYSAVSTRAVEIATLRAIGFGGLVVVSSVIVEALLLTSVGAAIGAGLAWVAFNGNLHAMGGATIRLAVTPGLVAGGIVFAAMLGLVGGLFPAIRAARLPVATALRAI
ncbi:MAG TPA: ABC transporter permease [Steroidobacteraceae bacterium]|nr:ABC transporter permease [Steroidobacteraceae bacterium]